LSKKHPQPADVLVGQNIRIYRLQNGLSQGELGRRIGVTFQQIQKYESGTNRVGASRMTEIARVLDVPIMSLFEGPSSTPDASVENTAWSLLTQAHALRLVQAFDRIPNAAARVAIANLVDIIAPARPRRRRTLGN